MQSYLRFIEQTIAAGGNLPIPGPGSLVVIKEASAPFDLEFDDNGKSTFEGGFTIDTGEDKFQKLTVHNRSNVAKLTIQLYVGRGSGKSSVSYDYLRVRATRLRPSDDFVAGNGIGNATTFPGVAPVNDATYSAYGINPGARRRQFAISTLRSNTSVIVLASAVDDKVFGFVAAGDSYTLETDEAIKVYASAAGQDCAIAELFNA
jgi:hypothetical protein